MTTTRRLTIPMMASEPDNNAGILRRGRIPWSERKVGWLPYLPSLNLAPCLVAALGRGFREVYIVGGWNAASTPSHEWFKAPAQEGWEVSYRPGNKHSLRSGDYERGGKKVTVRMSAAWFDAYDNVPQSAYDDLRKLLHDRFGEGAHLFGTPARTGLDLLKGTLPDNRDYLPSPLDVQETIRHNFGQGHRYPVAPADLEHVRSIAVYDAVWMYASCIRHLPVILRGAALRYDTIDEYAGPYVPGFYRVIFRVPPGWEYPGLLSYRDPAGGRAFFPNSGKAAYETWCTEPELRLAAQDWGWPVRIRERILYAHQSTAGSDPAREWIRRLRTMRETAPSEPVRSAVRHLCLDTVGSWARKGRTEWHVIPGDEAELFPPDVDRIIPIYAYDRRGNPVKRLYTEWSRPAPLDPSSQPFVRPEWAAQVWGRSRAKLHAFMLTFPPRCLLWLRDDAVAIDPQADNIPTTRLEDGDLPGSFRVKKLKSWTSDVAVPRDETTWRALMDEPAEDDDETDGDIDGPQED